MFLIVLITILFAVIIIIFIIIIIIIVIAISVVYIGYDGVNLDHELILLLADGVLLEHLLEHDPVPEFHPLREHSVLLPDILPNVQVDAGSAGVLGSFPQGYSRSRHR